MALALVLAQTSPLPFPEYALSIVTLPGGKVVFGDLDTRVGGVLGEQFLAE